MLPVTVLLCFDTLSKAPSTESKWGPWCRRVRVLSHHGGQAAGWCCSSCPELGSADGNPGAQTPPVSHLRPTWLHHMSPCACAPAQSPQLHSPRVQKMPADPARSHVTHMECSKDLAWGRRHRISLHRRLTWQRLCTSTAPPTTPNKPTLPATPRLFLLPHGAHQYCQNTSVLRRSPGWP